MKQIRWKIYDGSKCVDTGTITAESDKQALAKIMFDMKGKLKPNGYYSFTVGELTTSSGGDELSRSALVLMYGMSEDLEKNEKYHFNSYIEAAINRIRNDHKNQDQTGQ